MLIVYGYINFPLYGKFRCCFSFRLLKHVGAICVYSICKDMYFGLTNGKCYIWNTSYKTNKYIHGNTNRMDGKTNEMEKVNYDISCL